MRAVLQSKNNNKKISSVTIFILSLVFKKKIQLIIIIPYTWRHTSMSRAASFTIVVVVVVVLL